MKFPYQGQELEHPEVGTIKIFYVYRDATGSLMFQATGESKGGTVNVTGDLEDYIRWLPDENEKITKRLDAIEDWIGRVKLQEATKVPSWYFKATTHRVWIRDMKVVLPHSLNRDLFEGQFNKLMDELDCRIESGDMIGC